MKEEEEDVIVEDVASNTDSITDASPLDSTENGEDLVEAAKPSEPTAHAGFSSRRQRVPSRGRKDDSDDNTLEVQAEQGGLFANHRDFTDGSISTHASNEGFPSPVDVVIVVDGGMENLHQVPEDAALQKESNRYFPAWVQQGLCLFSIVIFLVAIQASIYFQYSYHGFFIPTKAPGSPPAGGRSSK